MTPRASFVIPAYNAEKYLSKAIYSCRNQTVKQIEIIVVNDGSTDDTGVIAETHVKADPRVKLFHVKPNRGRSAARNLGNENAESSLILVLDSDDMAARNRVKDTIAAFQLKRCDLLYGSFFVIDGMSNVLSRIPAMAFDPEKCREKKLNFICHSTMAYTKKLTESVQYEGGVYSDLGLDDWKFQWDAFNKGFSIKHLKNPLSYYRDTKGNTMNTRNEEEVAKVKEAYFAEAK